METCFSKRLTIGAPGQEAMKKVIAEERAYLNDDCDIDDDYKIR